MIEQKLESKTFFKKIATHKPFPSYSILFCLLFDSLIPTTSGYKISNDRCSTEKQFVRFYSEIE